MHEGLLERYGTAKYKQAEIPIAHQLAAAIMGTGLMLSDHAHVQELEQEAAMMTEMSREYEARKMDQTISALDPKMAAARAILEPAIKVAAAAAVALRSTGGAAQAADRLKLGGIGGSLLGGVTKAKVLGGGALLGAGYLGMKGLQATRDYMTIPSGTHHAPGPPNNVNSAGYPEY